MRLARSFEQTVPAVAGDDSPVVVFSYVPLPGTCVLEQQDGAGGVLILSDAQVEALIGVLRRYLDERGVSR